MPITADQDCLVLDQRCVAAFYLGTEEALQRDLARAGIDASLNDIRARAEVNTEAWRMNDLEKTSCYLCNSPRQPGSLCECFKAVMPTRYFNVNEKGLMKALPPTTVVETFVCDGCGCLDAVTAGTALRCHERAKRYVVRKKCAPCHQVFREEQHNQKRLESVRQRQEKISTHPLQRLESPRVMPEGRGSTWKAPTNPWAPPQHAQIAQLQSEASAGTTAGVS